MTVVRYRTRLGTLQQQLRRRPASVPWVVRRALTVTALDDLRPGAEGWYYFALIDAVVALTAEVRRLRSRAARKAKRPVPR